MDGLIPSFWAATCVAEKQSRVIGTAPDLVSRHAPTRPPSALPGRAPFPICCRPSPLRQYAADPAHSDSDDIDGFQLHRNLSLPGALDVGEAGDLARRGGHRLETVIGQEGGLSSRRSRG